MTFRYCLAGLAILGASAALGHAAGTMARITSQSFNSTFAGLVFPYTPFDPSLGELKQVAVQGRALLTTTGTAYPFGSGVYYPIQMQFDLSVQSPTGEGVNFSGPWTYYFNDAIGPGGASSAPALPVAYTALQEFSYTIDPLDDAAGVTTMHWTDPPLGTAVSPVLAEASFAKFSNPGGGVGSVVNITPIVTPASVTMDLPTLGGGMTVMYQYTPSDLGDDVVDDGGFDDGLNQWQTSGPGQADLVTENVGDRNTAARLTTGSPITLSQLVDTPDQSFRIQFDYAFLTTDGTLEVQLDGQGLATLVSDLGTDVVDGQTPWFRHFSTEITDGNLQGLTGVPFAWTWDGPSGSQILVDNVSIAPITVPEPTSLALAAALGLGGELITRRRG